MTDKVQQILHKRELDCVKPFNITNGAVVLIFLAKKF